MDLYSSPYIIPNSSLHNPFPHSLLRSRQTVGADMRSGFELDDLGLVVSRCGRASQHKAPADKALRSDMTT